MDLPISYIIMKAMGLKIAAILVLISPGRVIAVNNGLARTPQMGWVNQLMEQIRILANGRERITGTPLAAMYRKHYFSILLKELCTQDSVTLGIIMSCLMIVGLKREMTLVFSGKTSQSFLEE